MMRRSKPPIGPVPDEHLDPLRALHAAITATLALVREADAAGDELLAKVRRSRMDDLMEERARLVGGRS